MRRLLLILLSSLLLFSCSTTADSNEGSHDLTSITISLPENPETGYQWVWGQMGSGHIEMSSSRYLTETGEHVFVFSGTVPGHVTLTFSSKNMETGINASQEIYSVTVYNDLTVSYL